MGAYFENSELGRGQGKSKKEAEQNAARDALSKKAFIGLKA
jgi:dsRNA-specific ribonuclease